MKKCNSVRFAFLLLFTTFLLFLVPSASAQTNNQPMQNSPASQAPVKMRSMTTAQRKAAAARNADRRAAHVRKHQPKGVK